MYVKHYNVHKGSKLDFEAKMNVRQRPRWRPAKVLASDLNDDHELKSLTFCGK